MIYGQFNEGSIFIDICKYKNSLLKFRDKHFLRLLKLKSFSLPLQQDNLFTQPFHHEQDVTHGQLFKVNSLNSVFLHLD